MSTALAIASVTQVLKSMISNGLQEDGVTNIAQSAAITSLPPDRIETGTNELNQLNLFLFMTKPNIGWRNHGLASHNAQGERISNPPLALDLHYMLSAYGTTEIYTDILIAYGMQILHENTVLARNTIETLLTPGGTLPPALNDLATSGLAAQIEQIKIIPDNINTEELSKLWTAFGAKYRPSAFYKASVVLIESQRPAKTALAVKKANVYVRPFRKPTISKISSQTDLAAPILDNQKILTDHFLVIQGIQLKGDITSLKIGALTINQSDFKSISDTQIVVQVPNTLEAGLQSVQVVQEIAMGEPATPHKGFSSNVNAFVLSPNIDNQSQIANTLAIQLDITPAIGEDQQVVLLLNELSATPNAYRFEYTPTSTSTNITIPTPDVIAGNYLLRIRVDNAESPIADDFNSPQITITSP